MPKQPTRKRTTKAPSEPAAPNPRIRAAAKKVKPAMAAGNAGVVHMCIQGCAGHGNFGPNDQLKNIPADAQCVQTCIIQETGKPVLVSETDTENDIIGML